MNSFRLLIVFYGLIIASLALAVDDFNGNTGRSMIKPKRIQRQRSPARQPNRVAPARAPRRQEPAPLYNPLAPATTPSLVTDPTYITPENSRDPASEAAPEAGSN